MHQFSASCVYLGLVLILLPTAPQHVTGILMLCSLAVGIGIWRTHVVFSRALVFISAHGVILGGQNEAPNVINIKTGIISLVSGAILYFLMPRIMGFFQSVQK